MIKAAASQAMKQSRIYRRIMMVPPTHFDVIHKNLNVYMDCSKPVDKVKAMNQWEGLRSTYEKYGLHPEICEPEPGLKELL